jgi:predicted ferric reductase
MWTIEFAETNGIKIKYQPGQFGFFSFRSDEIVEEEHPFSISSGNTVDHMSITVKELGDFTRQIKHLKAGDKVYVDAPYGRFSYLNHMNEKDLVFIAGGVGITPMISMLRHMMAFEPNRKVTLLWGMNLLSDYIMKVEFEKILDAMPNMTIIPVIAQDKEYQGEKGYIDHEKLQRLLQEQLLKPSSTGYYLCGPPVLMDNSIANLKKLGVNDKYIHFERFSL